MELATLGSFEIFARIIVLIVCGIVATFLGSMLILGCFNKWLSVWVCGHMGWHLEPKEQGFDGCSANGTCPRCGKKVMLDSQGNWF